MKSYSWDMGIGVEDLSFSLTTPCTKNQGIKPSIQLSFCIHGPFNSAAMSDCLNDTVDYEALCNHIMRAVSACSCDAPDIIVEEMKIAIKSFSPIKTYGSLTFSINCHHGFTKEIQL